MSDGRPNPDDLLKAVQGQEHERGRLKVFLGASAGVGKTYAMLTEAHERKRRGQDVVIGYVEAHQRAETHAMVEGLEEVPLRRIYHRGAELFEVDVAAIIKRHPEIVLVDELAHNNAPGSTHNKRWQDINDLLAAGISVFTAVNIQHLESLNDVVAQVTGVRVQETVPDSFFDQADDIELIDLAPGELQQRLKEGKVYLPERVEHALEGFFKTTNLTALRELALRRAADSVDAEMQRLRIQEGAKDTWATRERIVVCIAPNRMATRVVRAAARMGVATHAELIAVYVESDRQTHRAASDHDHAQDAIDLSQELGFEIIHLHGHDIVAEIVGFARRRNATLIVVGKPIRPRWREILFGSVVDYLVRASGDIDVHVITDVGEPTKAPPPAPRKIEAVTRQGILLGLFSVTLASGLGFLFLPSLHLANVAMIYVLGVALAATRLNRTESSLLSIVSVLAFNFLFVEPRFSFAVSDIRYLVLFGAMLTIGVVISSLTYRLREQIRVSSERERRTSSLYMLSRQMAQAPNNIELAKVAASEISSVFSGDVAIFFRTAGRIDLVVPSESGFEKNANEQAVATWVSEHHESAGKGTTTLPGSLAYYMPLKGAETVVGVLALKPRRELDGTAQLQLLETFGNGLGLALERSILSKQSSDARVTVESERIRSTLLSSISHDLRTPLTSITGAASTLVSGKGNTKELAQTIYSESTRLNQQIQNLLDMTRLQSGGVELKLTWQSPQELVASAVEKCKTVLEGRELKIEFKGKIELIEADGLLVEKALTNVLDNAAKFTQPGDEIKITVFSQGREMIFLITDQGQGFPAEALGKVFTPGFHVGSSGFGLGLAIVEAITKLHGGRSSATNVVGGGAAVRLEFPLPERQPEVPHD